MNPFIGDIIPAECMTLIALRHGAFERIKSGGLPRLLPVVSDFSQCIQPGQLEQFRHHRDMFDEEIDCLEALSEGTDLHFILVWGNPHMLAHHLSPHEGVRIVTPAFIPIYCGMMHFSRDLAMVLIHAFALSDDVAAPTAATFTH